MGLWIIAHDDERVRLTYTHEPLAQNPLVQPCGAIELAGEVDLEAWVFDEANPWDLIRTPRGTFMRQHAQLRQDGSPPRVESTPVPWPGALEGAA